MSTQVKPQNRNSRPLNYVEPRYAALGQVPMTFRAAQDSKPIVNQHHADE